MCFSSDIKNETALCLDLLRIPVLPALCTSIITLQPSRGNVVKDIPKHATMLRYTSMKRTTGRSAILSESKDCEVFERFILFQTHTKNRFPLKSV